MTALRLDDVGKDYGGRPVLDGLTLDVAQRSFVALVGPSGAGKTTLLRLLLGEAAPDRGAILLDGAALPPEPGPDRGVVFQRYSVFPHLTVLGNVMLGPELAASRVWGRARGALRRRIEGEARALLAEVGLAGTEDRYPAQLSGGMQQRLALAQALAMRPRLLLLDEPFGALDPGTRAEMHALLRRLWHEVPVTVVMVTHDLREAFALATRVVALERPRGAGPAEPARVGTDLLIWPPRVAGARSPYDPQPGRDDPAPPGPAAGTTRPRREPAHDDPPPYPDDARPAAARPAAA